MNSQIDRKFNLNMSTIRSMDTEHQLCGSALQESFTLPLQSMEIVTYNMMILPPEEKMNGSRLKFHNILQEENIPMKLN